MLKWVVKQSKTGGGGGEDSRTLRGHYRTLSEDRHKRQCSIDSSVSSVSSNRTADSKSKGKERSGRPKQRTHPKTTRAKSSGGILEQASYNKVQDWDVSSKEDLRQNDVFLSHQDSEPKTTKRSDSKPNAITNRITLSYLENLSHIQSLEKLTDFRDSSCSSPGQIPDPSDLPQHLKDEGIDVKEPTDFDPSAICGSKMSMMDESFEVDQNNDAKSVKSSSDQSENPSESHSENHSENGDSSTDSAVVMGDVTEHELAPKVHAEGLRGFAAGIRSEDLGKTRTVSDKKAADKKASSAKKSWSITRTKKEAVVQPVAPPRNRSRKQKVQTMDARREKEVREDAQNEEERDELDSLPNRIFMRGSDPLIQTARGKLQSRRSKLNDQINLELRLRAGAENLYKATTNKKLRETVALELSYVNSTLQSLKEELADLNSSVQVYQSHGSTQCPPMIPLGLKETKDVDFTKPFMEMIENHYHEDPKPFEKEIQQVIEMRQACRTPVRSEDGINLLYEYFNQLYFIDRRFFPQQKSQSIYFEWFDSLTGVPNAQRTVGFEKGSILFNIGALHTQIGARQDRSTEAGIACARKNFEQAAGALQHLSDNFSNAPSTDMQTDTLDMLTHLMLAQAQECIFEQRVLGGTDLASGGGIKTHLGTAHEASQVHSAYHGTKERMMFDKIKTFVPQSWISMVTVKGEYFRAISHYHTSLTLLANLNNNNNNSESNNNNVTEEAGYFNNLYVRDAASRKIMESASVSFPPKTAAERKLLAKAHLREAILSHEEALRVHGMSRQLRKMDMFYDILKLSHDQSLQMYGELEEEDDFTELVAVPNVQGIASEKASPVPPDFSQHLISTEAVFNSLGPLAIFSARHRWSPRRRVVLRRPAGREYGFSVRGDSPVIVAAVETNSIAHKQGLRVGDFIVAVGEQGIKWSQHEDVVTLIRDAHNHLVMDIITPVDRNYLDPTWTATEPRSKGQRSNSHGQLLEQKSATVAVRPSSASNSSSSRRFSLGDGTLKKNQKNGTAAKSGKISMWTLRRNRSKSREKTLEAIAMSAR